MTLRTGVLLASWMTRWASSIERCFGTTKMARRIRGTRGTGYHVTKSRITSNRPIKRKLRSAIDCGSVLVKPRFAPFVSWLDHGSTTSHIRQLNCSITCSYTRHTISLEGRRKHSYAIRQLRNAGTSEIPCWYSLPTRSYFGRNEPWTGGFIHSVILTSR